MPASTPLLLSSLSGLPSGSATTKAPLSLSASNNDGGGSVQSSFSSILKQQNEQHGQTSSSSSSSSTNTSPSTSTNANAETHPSRPAGAAAAKTDTPSPPATTTSPPPPAETALIARPYIEFQASGSSNGADANSDKDGHDLLLEHGNDPALAALLSFFLPVPHGSASPRATSDELTEHHGRDGDPAQDGTSSSALLSALDASEARLARSGKTADFSAADALSAADGNGRTTGLSPAERFAAEHKGNSDSDFNRLLDAAQNAGTLSATTAATTLRPDPASSAPPAVRIDAPLGSERWNQSVGDKLVWMSSKNEQRVELILNPPALGRVDVTLKIHGDQTTASFMSANPQVREALENALPRLREMFADAGLSLGQANVGADSGSHAAHQPFDQRGNRADSSSFSATADDSGRGNMQALTGASPWLQRGRGMVDVFA